MSIQKTILQYNNNNIEVVLEKSGKLYRTGWKVIGSEKFFYIREYLQKLSKVLRDAKPKLLLKKQLKSSTCWLNSVTIQK